MRPLTSVFALLLSLAIPAVAFGQVMIGREAMRTVHPGAYPVPGSHLLQAENQKVLDYIGQHPESVVRSGLQKPSWNFAVGSTHTWKSQNIATQVFFDVPSTCRAIGTHCYMFVEDAIWGTKATQTAVDAVMNEFDSHTPADPSKGVYQMDVETFGAPPNIDGDPKIVILILDIKDGFSGSGPYVAGYFWGGNEVSGYPNGNNAEIYYVDANPLDLTHASGVTQAMSTAAHEFQHMIHFGRDPQEETFINEGCSCFAQSNCGYGIRDQNGYVNETNRSLLDWRLTTDPEVVNDYSRAGRFFQYIGDQFGAGVLMPIVASTSHGIAGLDAGLASYAADRRFAQIFPDWLVANILDDRTVNPYYGYLYPDLLKAVGTNCAFPVVPLTQGTVSSLAADYISYTGGADLRITFTTSSSSLVIKAVEIGTPSRVLNVTPGVEFHEAGFGTTYSAIHFVVINTSQSASANYSYQSSGSGSTSVELKYDNSDPTAFLGLQAGDTACVWFSGVPGTHLDSVRVALQRLGSISGGVYRSTGVENPTPLGARLAVPVTATRTDASTPWVKIDLRSYGINTGTDFAVAFAFTGTYLTNPRVMVVEEPYSSGGTFHSYTYYADNAPTNPAGWYILYPTADTAYAYSIRAYVSYGATDVRGPAELLPLATRLEQNYPNPFNPKTGIRFQVSGVGVTGAGGQGPGVTNTKLVVYDLLGREVAVLVNERKAAGSYEVSFDGSGLASGVYIYRLTAGSFVASKRMVLVK